MKQIIEKNGFKPAKDLTDKSRHTREYLDDVMVDLDRNGNPLLVDGKHRAMIAKILDLDKIPVRVVCRHEKWQEKREKAIKNPDQLPDKIKEHPDIKNLIE